MVALTESNVKPAPTVPLQWLVGLKIQSERDPTSSELRVDLPAQAMFPSITTPRHSNQACLWVMVRVRVPDRGGGRRSPKPKKKSPSGKEYFLQNPTSLKQHCFMWAQSSMPAPTGLPRAGRSTTASPADIRKVCVRLHSGNPEPTMLISPTTLDEHPPTSPPCRWPALITLLTLTKFQLVWRRLCDVVLFHSSCLSEHTLTAVCALTECHSLIVNISYIQTFCEHLNVLYIFDQTDLYHFEVSPELYGAHARLIFS